MAEELREQPRVLIPLWVALAGMVVALILAGIIMSNVLKPLISLIFPATPDLPLPAGVIELEEVGDPLTSDGEWLYGVEMDGCQVVQFYLDAGARCRLTPFVCEQVDGKLASNYDNYEFAALGTCDLVHEGEVDSYTWQLVISSGYEDYETKYRVYLYRERN